MSKSSYLISNSPGMPIFSAIIFAFELVMFDNNFVGKLFDFCNNSPVLISKLKALFIVTNHFTPSFGIFIKYRSP